MPLFNPPYIPDLYAPNQTVGDTIYFDGTNWTRLAIGASGSYLYTSGTSAPRWTTDISGSLQRLRTGETYLAAGANVSITTQSNGQVIISTSTTGSSGSPANTTPYSDQLGELFIATVTQSVYRKSLPVTTANGWLVNNFGMMLVTTSSIDPNYLTAGTVYATGTGADVSASYIVIGVTASLPNERALTQGTGIRIIDTGAGGNVSVAINDGIVATVSGTTFTGPVLAPSLSGSLQRLSTGETYIAAGAGMNVTTSSTGQVNIAFAGSIFDPNASYLVLSATSSLNSDRVLTVSGSALSMTDVAGVATLDITNTGSAGTFGAPIAVNNKGQVTSGSTTWFGRDFSFVTSSTPFHNVTTKFLSVLNMTASNLSSGIYRLGWSYNFRSNTTTRAFRSQIVIGTTASYDTYMHSPNAAAPERIMQDGFTYVRITGSVQLFDVRISLSAAATNTTASVYDRAIELWRVS